jgi:hypothetical protein
MEQCLPSEAVTLLAKKFPALNGTQRFITVFTGSNTGPYPEPFESIPHHYNLFL